MPDHLDTDVIIVGAGLSGIAAAWHLQQVRPELSVSVLEARADLGGTWDLFRYPGVRSDSDILTYAFPFRPWTGQRGLASGSLILDYLRETATESGIASRIQYSTRVVSAQWHSSECRWLLATEDSAGRVTQKSCRFLFMATGYFSYESGYTPEFKGLDEYQGSVIHPQHWPAAMDYADARVLVIGSGATAVTLVPAMARHARHVTMLQRSPSHIIALPRPKGNNRVFPSLPGNAANSSLRFRNLAANQAFYAFCRASPARARQLVRRTQLAHLDNQELLSKHFTPTYGPWEQRLCAAPDGDLFRAIAEGRASVVTDSIETFDRDGVQLASGRAVPADIIVTATGLSLEPLGGIELRVDDKSVNLPDHYVYRGVMLSGVPNFAFALGYANASWTLRADLSARYAARLLTFMHRHSFDAATPVAPVTMARAPLMTLMAGYLRRRGHLFPTHGDRGPWLASRGYFHDRWILPRSDLTTDMAFGRR